MKEDLKNLLKLQEIDNEIFNIQLSKEKIPEDIEEISNLLTDKKAGLEHAKNKTADLEKNKRTLENEIKVEEERIQKDKEKLMQVKSNEEYHALLRETDNSRREISDRETEIIKLLDEIDSSRRAVNEITSELNEIEKEMNVKKDELNQFLKDVDRNIEIKMKQRGELAKKVDPSLLKKYNRIKEKKEYCDVLMSVVDYACGGCNMHIPHQMVNELRGMKKIHVCPTCERILYWSDTNEENN